MNIINQYLIFKIIDPRYTRTIVAGFAFAVVAVLLSSILLNAYSKYIENEFLSIHPHIAVHLNPKQLNTVILNQSQSHQTLDAIITELQKIEGIKTVKKAIYLRASAIVGGIRMGKPENIHETNLIIKGMEITGITELIRQVEKGKSKRINLESLEYKDQFRVLLNKKFAYALFQAPLSGDELVLKFNFFENSQAKVVPKLNEQSYIFKLAGTIDVSYFSGKYQYIFTSIDNIFKLLKNPRINTLEIALSDINDEKAINTILNKISKELPNAKIEYWMDSNKAVFAILSSLDILIFLVSLIIFALTCFSIYSALHITIREKRQSIALLKALGTREKDILLWFFNYGLFIALAGLSLACLISFLLLYSASYFEIGAHLPILEKLIKNIDYMDTILDIKFISKLAFALIFALLACYIPSRAAGALDPADGLKEE